MVELFKKMDYNGVFLKQETIILLLFVKTNNVLKEVVLKELPLFLNIYHETKIYILFIMFSFSQIAICQNNLQDKESRD
jgi:hypothetical protein